MDSAVVLAVIGTGFAILTLLYRHWVKKLDAESLAEAVSQEPGRYDDIVAGMQRAAASARADALVEDALLRDAHLRDAHREDAVRDPIKASVVTAEALPDTPWHTAYVEAALILIRSGRPAPGIRDELRELIDASEAGDKKRFVEAAKRMPEDEWYTALALGAERWPKALAQLGLELGRAPHNVLIDALAKDDEEHCLELLRALEWPAEYVVGAALSSDTRAITKRFESLGASLHGDDKDYWEECRLRRLARSDLDSALAELKALIKRRAPPWRATFEVLRAATAREAAEGQKWIDSAKAPARNRLPLLLGAAAGGLDVRTEIDDIVSALSDETFMLTEVFAELLRHALRQEDPELLTRVLRRGGALPWQVTLHARDELRNLAEKASSSLNECVEALLVEVAPGCMARRSVMAVNGDASIRPDWLWGERNPLEILVLQTALFASGGEAPRWNARRDRH